MTQDQVHPITFDDLQSAILPLFAIAQDATWNPLGTAFLVAVPEPKKALLLTAAHNIIPLLAIDGQRDRCHPTTPMFFRNNSFKSVDLRRTNVHALLMLNNDCIIAEMIKVWLKPECDIAAILVSIAPDIDSKFPSLIAIDTRPIDVGTPVMAVGYPVMEADFTEPPDYDAVKLKVGVKFRMVYKLGKVTQLCPEGVGIHKWPGFLVDFPFDSGMSGGPVVDLSSAVPTVRGLIGGDISEVPQQDMHGSGSQAFTTMIWLAMIIKTQITFLKDDGQQLIEDAQLVDLARHGIINDKGFAQNHIRSAEISAGIVKYWWDPHTANS